MACCESLEPVVLLNDVMFAPEKEESSRSSGAQTDDCDAFRMDEQTEPLNLCLGGFAVIECFRSSAVFEDERSKKKKDDDDDVIFVKEYTAEKGRGGQRKEHQGKEPRRNPKRKARDSKRFKEYTDMSFDEEEFVNEPGDNDNFLISETIELKDEDSEDWKIENIVKRTRRKKVFGRKAHRLGRRRKINAKDTEKKVKLRDLEDLFESNLLLIKNYILNVKQTKTNEEQEEKISDAVLLFKQQAIFLSTIKDSNFDLENLLKS